MSRVQNLHMEFVNLPLLIAAAVVFASVLTGLLSARIGLSSLLVFLMAGILTGEDGIGGLRFDDFHLSFWVGNLALAVILLDGGLRTAFATFRTGLRPAALLASAGVVITAGITALAGMWLLDLQWPSAMLLGAIVGSTDAAAVFALLTRSGVTLNERVAATLEIESGVNDPMAVYLTLALIALVLAADPGLSLGSHLVLGFMQQFGWGTALGLAAGFAMAWLLPKLRTEDAGGGILALLLGAGGLAVFAAAGLLGGSGFLAVYLFGLIVANRAAASVEPALVAMDGYAWLAQAGMFLLLGLLVTPSRMMPALWPSLGVALVLMLVARPLAVWLCLLPFRFSAREIWFISWVGLRGAVPIVLALFPLLAGVPQAYLLFNVAFVVVLVSLLLQGSTIGLVARRLGVAMPEPSDEQRVRKVFGDFGLDPAMPIGDVCEFYALPAPAQPSMPLREWLARQLGRPPVAGDRVRLGGAVFVVRAHEDGTISNVGLRLER
jgi:potassium/hydrogen antiporter